MKLIIAEKPSVARSIAEALGIRKRGEGYLEGNGYLVSWCLGHIVSLADSEAYDQRYAKWSYADLPIIPEKWQYTVLADKRDQFLRLKGLLEDERVEGVICATDAGREGELIFRWVYKMAGCKKPAQRLWISSMEKEAILAGMASLQDIAAYDRLYAAAESRARADWVVGINATRLFTVLYHKPLHVGRVQSPTLALIVGRDLEIAHFTKKKFYHAHLDCGGMDAKSPRIEEKPEAEALRALCDGKDAIVRKVEKTKRTENPPKLYDLTSLQRDANRLHGLTAQQTLDTAQRLYENKRLTYPRTDSRYLPGDMEETAQKLVMRLRSLAEPPDVRRMIRDDKVSDHHALLPTMQGLAHPPVGGEEQLVFDLVCAQLRRASGDAHIYEQTVVTLECEGKEFTARGRMVLQNGWKKEGITEEEDAGDEQNLPPLKEGQIFPSVKASLSEHNTSPPKPYTEDTLLSAMERAGNDALDSDDVEKRGLGTPATRAAIIERLVVTGSVLREGKKLLSTDKGRTLISLLPENIKSPYLTAGWENTLTRIALGEASAREFMRDMEDMTRNLVAENKQPLRSVQFEDTRESLGPCPRCGTKVVEGPKGYHCARRECGFSLWKDNRFFEMRKKKLTKTAVKALLKKGKAPVKGFVAEKTGKKYDAIVVMEDSGEKYVRFHLEFPQK